MGNKLKMLLSNKRWIIITLLLPVLKVGALNYDGRFGWPTQEPPRKIIICEYTGNKAEDMLLESLAGLAAQAVNEKRFDEMVWVDINNNSYRDIFTKTVNVLNIKSTTKMTVWELARYLKKKGVVKGYILYDLDKPRLDPYKSYDDINYSVNVATVYASLLQGLLADRSIINEIQKLGFRQLKDASNESSSECFAKNKSKLNNCSALSIPSSVINLREYAIAHKLMLYADQKDIIDDILKWVRPLSPIIGWGVGDEYDFTSLISSWGHYNTASNWCHNLSLISSVADRVELKKAKEVTPDKIDFKDNSSFHSFVMSDGDNMQWTMGSFLNSTTFLGNRDIDKVGLSWTLCPINLSIISPFSWNTIVEVQQNKMSFIEYGGGYQYPDIFAIKRPNRAELLREFAARVNLHMKKLNIKIFGFICKDVSSDASQQAFQIYAEEMEDITGMMAVQYFPYELEGEIYWKKNKKGIDIPIVAARYGLWNEVNKYRPRGGTPDYISAIINREDMYSRINEKSTAGLHYWTIVHAWSNYEKSSKMPIEQANGVNAVKFTESMLLDNIKTVSANELLWRIRMRHNAKQTENCVVNADH